MSPRNFFSFLLLFSFFAYPLSAQNNIDIKAEKKLLSHLESELFEAVVEKDIEKAASYLDEGAEWMPANAPSVKGRDKIRTRLEESFKNQPFNWKPYSIKVSDPVISASGDLAVVQHDAKKPMEFKWVNVWKKVNGEWKCAIIIDNISTPAQ